MKVKHIIVIFLIAFGLSVLGAVFKILHLQGAPQLLLFSGILNTLGVILSIWKVLTNEKFKDFLNS